MDKQRPDDEDGTDDGTDGKARGRRRRRRDTTGHEGTDGQRTDDDDDDDGTDDGTDGRTKDDDGDNGTDTTGRTRRAGRTIYIVPKFQTQHWEQFSSVTVHRP